MESVKIRNFNRLYSLRPLEIKILYLVLCDLFPLPEQYYWYCNGVARNIRAIGIIR